MATPTPTESIIEPDLPIVDAHHHLWFLSEGQLAAIENSEALAGRALAPTFRRHARYLLDELLADVASGHNIRATIFVDAHAMYRPRGPMAMRSVGEVEFANGVAAMAASETFGTVKVCAGIVGNVDLRLGEGAEEVLNAHIQAGGSRYRGVRGAAITAYDEDSSILGQGGVPHLLLDPKFRLGFNLLGKLRLSYDAWLLEPQLPELISLARVYPDTQIILNHTGGPLGVGRYAGRREERFPLWRENIRTLATCQNVTVKLGGLGMPMPGFKTFMSAPQASSAQLAQEWKPYVETCIDSFGADRCMFESNFPVDAGSCSYLVLWNAFKRLTAGASKEEKKSLFGGTAMRIYRIDT